MRFYFIITVFREKIFSKLGLEVLFYRHFQSLLFALDYYSVDKYLQGYSITLVFRNFMKGMTTSIFMKIE